MPSKDLSNVRIIKKYPNRRLYDTEISSYITLNDIKELVMSYCEFKVIDAKTKADLTRCTLMQIIAEEETNGQPIMSSEILKEFENVFVSGTFGGECLSIAAAIATINKLEQLNVHEQIWSLGNKLIENFNRTIDDLKLQYFYL